MTGKKVEIYSLPYSAINMWSSENAGGMLDTNAELEMWTRAGHIKIKVGKGADIRRLDSLIAWAVLK
ncbi:PH domain-containing protein [Nocardioides sp. HB32]